LHTTTFKTLVSNALKKSSFSQKFTHRTNHGHHEGQLICSLIMVCKQTLKVSNMWFC